MAVTTVQRRDTRIKCDVLQELEWDPRVDVTDVGVERRAALHAASWASGVRAIEDHVIIDEDIAV